MNRIDKLFIKKNKDILNIYFTAGFPNLESTGVILEKLSDASVDLVEIGMPYSDPLADGPTIQNSGQKALANGMSIKHLFKQIEVARKTIDTPLILMGYFNQVMQYGEEKFFRKIKEIGVDGLILPDMPLHIYERAYRSLFEELDLGISFLISPQTDLERIKKIEELSRGFIYMVSSASITGVKNGIDAKQIKYFERINSLHLTKPVLIGFGISDNKSFRTACEYSNGAIIGSAFIKAINSEEPIEQSISNFINKIRFDTIPV